MAVKMIKIDDLDGTEETEDYDVLKVSLGVAGGRWDIDLGRKNRQLLFEVLTPFIKAGRFDKEIRRSMITPELREFLDSLTEDDDEIPAPAAVAHRSPTPERPGHTRSKEDLAKARAWLIDLGVKKPLPPRLANDMLLAYDEQDPTLLNAGRLPVPPTAE